MKNPYIDFIKQMQMHGAKNNPPNIQLGEVISSDPLTAKIGDLQLNANNLLVSDYLLKGYTRTLSANDSSTSYKTEDTLNAGDTVALYQIDSATFLILSRVVMP